MRGQGYFYFSRDAQPDVWKRYIEGESLSDISRALCKNIGTIHRLIGYWRGVSPYIKKRSSKQLILSEKRFIAA